MNSSGPDAYQNAFKILEGIDKKEPIFSNSNQRRIKYAIKIIEYDQKPLDPDEASKNDSLLSLLYFVKSDYVKAKKYAYLAIINARKSEIRRTLPAFIYATSMLYEENFNFTLVTRNYLRYSILAEPDNPLIPLLFSIYLDRMLLRFKDNYLDAESLMQIFNIMKSPGLDNVRVQNYTILLSRYFICLKIEQQKILSLVDTSNDTIKESPKTLRAVNKALERYNVLSSDSNHVMSEYLLLDLDHDSRVKATEFHQLLIKYIQDKEELASRVEDLKKYQDELSYGEPERERERDLESERHTRYIYLIIIILIGALLVTWYVRRRPGDG